MITPLVWPAIANLHGVATKGKWFYGTGYDLSKIAVIDMDNEYKQKIEYTFPADFNNFNNPYSDGVYHGEALTVAGDYLYALFYVNKGKGYLNYYDSIVAKFEIDTATGELYFESYVTVGKNTFTLDLYENKLYACSLGGMQQVGTGNADTNICIIDLDNFTQNGVVTVNIANPLTDGDIRDISIVNDDNVYVFAGHYGGNYTNFIGKVYHTSLANLTNPTLWTPIITVDDHGYLWGIYADGYRLWFVKGTPIAVYNGTPSTAVSADRTFSITDMSDYVGGNLNSACFIAPDKVVTRGVAAPAVAKSMASQIRLAREARELAKKLQEKDK
ncbi:hypothetical protein [Pectinatus sottacetonis]|uniref:hypothetical protein n=1 Tax=Pectinatus sottacetonis TaxID=1002795 RepID=UPI0018C461D9|nr:hypothetical protein [Pectinatus sottacetonis]